MRSMWAGRPRRRPAASRPFWPAHADAGQTTGYVGSQRGADGAKNLLQVGGGQNTFGAAPPPATGIAQNVNVVGGVGQSGSQVLAMGSFSAPATEGVYTLSLANVVANVVETINAAPNFSPVVGATDDASNGSITFTVMGGGTVCADSNCDGSVTVSDIAFFVTAVTGGEAGWNALFPGGTAPCDFLGANDISGDGFVTVSDIAFFVNAVTNGGCP